MSEVQRLQQKLNWANKRVSYAWANYYQALNERHQMDYNHYQIVYRNTTTEAVPEHIKNELKEMANQLKKTWECAVCFEFIQVDNLDITNCGHYFCKGCISRHKETQKNAGKHKWECPTCRREHSF